MDALRLTSSKCSDNGLVRNYADEYAGPQSFVQRENLRLMQLTPGPRLAPTRNSDDTRDEKHEDDDLEWIQCDLCSKWRRVDHKTYSLYHGDTWFRESQLARRTALLEEFPALPSQLSLWMSARFDDVTSPYARDSENDEMPLLMAPDVEQFCESVDPHDLLTSKFK